MSAEEHVTEEDSGEWNRFYTPYDEESYDVYVIVRDTLSGTYFLPAFFRY